MAPNTLAANCWNGLPSNIQPGQQNADIERYSRTVRHEFLDQYIIETNKEAQDFAIQWPRTYNNNRPNVGSDPPKN